MVPTALVNNWSRREPARPPAPLWCRIDPFESWHDKLDLALQRVVDARLTHLAVGNIGDHKAFGAAMYELRIMKGPALRVYYVLKGDEE